MTVYAGTSIFFANRPGNHNYLDNNQRPVVTSTTTHQDGTKTYQDLFLGKDVAVKETKTHISFTIPKNIKTPMYRYLIKS